jgi:hypothetical protein
MARRKVELWVIDCETDPFEKGLANPQPFIWGAYCFAGDAAGRYETFGDWSLVVLFFQERRACCYAHNGGKFDFHYMRAGFESESPVLVINGRIAKFRIGLCEFRDSFSLLPIALARYQKTQVDYAIFKLPFRNEPANWVTICDYLKSDCINLATILARFFADYGRPLTLAGCALNIWVRRYNDGVKPRQTAAQFERYKPFYYGGRVECFASGWKETDFTVIDKNSAYPDAMLNEHPATPEGTWLSDIPSEIEQCLVCCEAVSDGALPFRGEDHSLSFPRDRETRVYWVTGWELKAGLELGLVKIKRVLEVHQFEDTQNFRGYIEHFYTARRAAQNAGDVGGDIINKLFMNGAYGKFAADPSKYNDFIIVAPERIAAKMADGWIVYKPWGDGRFLMHQPVPESRHWYYNIATAASITGYVRAQLCRDLNRTSGVIYCDTDSIAARGVSDVTIGKNLGEWKVELECDAYAVAGKKMYAFRSSSDLYKIPRGAYKIACKGVDLTADEIIRAARGERIVYEPEVPTYSITRALPCLINRVVTNTAKVSART